MNLTRNIFKIVFALLIVSAQNACFDKNIFPPPYGKARLGELSMIKVYSNDSCVISGRILKEEKRHWSYTSSSHLLVISDRNDTIINKDVWLEGINFVIPSGIYNFEISSYGCRSLLLEGLRLESNQFYDADFVLVKGRGTEKYRFK
jgi:hypothetical protein